MFAGCVVKWQVTARKFLKAAPITTKLGVKGRASDKRNRRLLEISMLAAVR